MNLIAVALTSLILTPVVFAEGKYKAVVIEDRKPTTSSSGNSTEIEASIKLHITDELGSECRYKSNPKRVLSVNLIEQTAGTNRGKFLADVAYVADPNMVGVINKDGLVIDAMRLLKVISQDKKTKANKIVTVLLRPHVIPAGRNSPEQVAKFQIDLSALAKISWDETDGAGFEQVLRSKGSIGMTPYMIQNGGKFLILKPEQLDL
jgi:hypothetical protein